MRRPAPLEVSHRRSPPTPHSEPANPRHNNAPGDPVGEICGGVGAGSARIREDQGYSAVSVSASSRGMWHFLYFLPLPQGHAAFGLVLPILDVAAEPPSMDWVRA